MKITRRTSITVKTERKFIAPAPLTAQMIYCPQCAEPMILAQICADIFSVSSRMIYRLIESGTVHFTETANNEIYVCPISLKMSYK